MFLFGDIGFKKRTELTSVDMGKMKYFVKRLVYKNIFQSTVSCEK